MAGLDCIVIDDSPLILKILSDSIQRLNHNVVAVFKDGVEFLEKMDQYSFDLIFLDIILPKKTGIEVLQEIIQRDPQAKVVILSGLAQNEIISAMLQIGAIDFIMKPFEEEKLRDLFLTISSSMDQVPGELLSKVDLACHMINLFFQELMTISADILRRVIRSQIESILISFQDELRGIIDIQPEALGVTISDEFWGEHTEEEVFNSLTKIINEIKYELKFIYSEKFVESHFNSAFLTLCSRSRNRRNFEHIDPELIGLPPVPSLDLEYDSIISATSYSQFEDSIAISLFVLDMMGPELVYHLNSDILSETAAFKSAIFYFTILNQGQNQFEGVFGPLPVAAENEDEKSKFSAVVYVTKLKDEVPALIIIYYRAVAEKIIGDYNRLNFIIKSRLPHEMSRHSISKSHIAGIREDIITFLAD